MDCGFPLPDDDLDDAELNAPVSPCGSAFDALCTLNPPSPILTPSQIAFTWSSGDIPVLLYDEAYADLDSERVDVDDMHDTEVLSSARDVARASASRNSIASTCTNRRDSAQSVRCVSGGANGRERMSIIDPAAYHQRRISSSGWRKSKATVIDSENANGSDAGLVVLPSLESSATVCSAGTFGPRRRRVIAKEVSRWSRDSEISSDDILTSSFGDENSASGGVEDDLVLDAKRASIQTISDEFSNPTILIDSARASRFSSERTLMPSEYNSMHGSEGQSDEEDQEDDNFLTPKKPSIPKAVSWVSSRDWDSGQYKAYVAREEPSRLALIPHSPESYEEPSPSHQVTPPNRRLVLGNRDINIQNIDTPCRSRARQEAHERYKESSKKGETRSPRDSSPRPVCHEISENNWLRDITIQFLIDQEGFRAAQPMFRFAGTARIRIGQNSKISETMLMAQFRPTTRQAFHFHYAPFETPPILRRVTANGDETHDYVSKQALLVLKVNGVYVLHGQEVLSAANYHHHDGETAKLHWHLEYLVDDRLTDGSGRIMEGEKILTPLTFSCSPALLLPTQGKKNTIMHIFKKGVAPKLVAEKLQPPGTTTRAARPKGGADNFPSSQTDAHISQFFSAKKKAQGWGLHRRGQSHGVRHAHMQPLQKTPTVQHSQDPAPNTARTIESQPIIHQRRNSSAGEHAKSVVNNARFSTMVSYRHRPELSGNKNSAFVSPTRHILPPAQLTKLLDSVEKENRVSSRISVQARNSTVFVPLAPRPRHTLPKQKDILPI